MRAIQKLLVLARVGSIIATECTDTCSNARYVSDGDCDDGGPGAEYYNCALGTDCTDCGPRGCGETLFQGDETHVQGLVYSYTGTFPITETQGPETLAAGTSPIGQVYECSGKMSGGWGVGAHCTASTPIEATYESSYTPVHGPDGICYNTFYDCVACPPREPPPSPSPPPQPPSPPPSPSSSSTSTSTSSETSSDETSTDESSSPSPPPAPPSPPAPPAAPSSPSDSVNVGLAVLCALCGVFGVFLVVLLVMDKVKGGKGDGWGPLGFLFPKHWAMIWVGYWLMLVFTCFIFPLIFASIPSFSSGGGMAAGEAIETLIALGPFLHCLLMPCTWVRTHRRNAKVAAEEPPKTPELDPDAKTVIFSMKLKTCDKLAVVFIGLIFGLIAKVLWLVKTISFGTLNFEGFWFPAPFYQFWEAKLFIKNLQIDGCKIRTKATQDDAYMRFCEEAMLNFFTLGFYKRCCAKKASFERWLDRSLVWVGKPPKGFNNQFRVFDRKLTLIQKIKRFVVMGFLFCFGGFLKYVPIVGGFWPVGQILDAYMYKIQLKNMRFGGSTPKFNDEFTYMNYIVKFYTVGMCGLCGAALKKWVDAQVVMGVPTFDAEMAAEDAEDAEMMSAGAATVMPTVHAPPVVQVQNQDPSFTNTEPISSADPSLANKAPAEP